MSQFFDPRTNILHEVKSYAGAVKLPPDIVANSIRVADPITALPKLRRQNGFNASTHPALFFSTETNTCVYGNFPLESPSNTDLRPISSTIEYK